MTISRCSENVLNITQKSKKAPQMGVLCLRYTTIIIPLVRRLIIYNAIFFFFNFNQVHATDEDKGVNGQVKYSIVQQPNQKGTKFTVNEETGEVLTNKVYTIEYST